MTSKDAIQHIEDVGSVLGLNKRFEDKEIPAAILPERFKLESLERFMSRPLHFRGKFVTQTIDEWVSYIESSLGSDRIGDLIKPRVFIDVDSMSATAYLDLGTPGAYGHGKHTAALSLRKCVEFRAIESMFNRPVPQRTLIDWIEDWGKEGSIRFFGDGDKELKPVSALAAVRAVTIECASEQENVVGNMKASMSQLEKLEARSKTGDLPEWIHILTSGWEGLGAETLQIRVGVLTSEKVPQFVLRPSSLDLFREQKAREFQEILRNELAHAVLSHSATIHVGGFSK